jgi:acyl carrier protein
MNAEVYQFLVEGLKNMNFDVSDVTEETKLGPGGLDLESLALADLAVQVEDTFSVKFELDEMEGIAMFTLGQLAEEVTAKAASQAAK